MKLKALQKHLKKKRLGACLLTSKDANFYYFVQQKVDTAILLIFKKGKPVVIVSRLEKISNPKVKVIESKNFIKTLKEVLKKNRVKKIGVNKNNLRMLLYKKIHRIVKLVDLEEFLGKLRITKTKQEIKYIKKACSITDKILKELISKFRFRTELDVKKFLKIQAIKHGCELSFEPIVANRKNAAVPHHMGNSRLQRGFLLIDFGLKYKSYCSDVSRTFCLGKPTKKEREIYKKVLKIQKAAIKMAKPGTPTVKIDAFVRDSFGEDAEYFFHGLGHGIGIQIHELPNLYQKSEDILKNNMVFTIEPGYYNKFGIRIEDDILLQKGKPIILTKFPKKLITISLNKIK